MDVDDLIGQLLSSEKLDLLVEKIANKALASIRKLDIVHKAQDYGNNHPALLSSTHDSKERLNEKESYTKGHINTLKIKSSKVGDSLKAGNFRLKFKNLANYTAKTQSSPDGEVNSYVKLKNPLKTRPKQETKPFSVDIIDITDENKSYLNYSHILINNQDDYLQKEEEKPDLSSENISRNKKVASENDNSNEYKISPVISGAKKIKTLTTQESRDTETVGLVSSVEELVDTRAEGIVDSVMNNHLPHIELSVQENVDEEVSNVENSTTSKKIIRQEGNKLFTFDSSSEYEEYHEEYKRSGVGNNEYFAF